VKFNKITSLDVETYSNKLPTQLSLAALNTHPFDAYELIMKKMEKNSVLQRNSGVSTRSILATRSDEVHSHTAATELNRRVKTNDPPWRSNKKRYDKRY
jgi:hypothetical protein